MKSKLPIALTLAALLFRCWPTAKSSRLIAHGFLRTPAASHDGPSVSSHAKTSQPRAHGPQLRADGLYPGVCGKLASMTLSARNQLQGTVEELQLGGVMAHVVVRVGENLVESVITRRSAEEMALKKGDSVKVIIKSTEVMLQKD